jgi:hypothetical protein
VSQRDLFSDFLPSAQLQALRDAATIKPKAAVRTLEAARAEVMEGRQRAKGIVCPCCDQLAKLYPRQICGTQVDGLAAMVAYSERYGYDWIRVAKFLARLPNARRFAGGDIMFKLVYWDLLEKRVETSKNDIGTTTRKGFARVTERGRRFIREGLEVPRVAYVYNGAVVAHSKDTVTVRQIEGTTFDYDELMVATYVG